MNKMEERAVFWIVLACPAVVFAISLAIVLMLRPSEPRQASEDLKDVTGFWIMDVEHESNKGAHVPGPFFFDGDTVVLQFGNTRPWLGGGESGYHRLAAKLNGPDLYYLSPAVDNEQKHIWEKLGTFNDGFFRRESNGRQCLFCRRDRGAVSRVFAGYFRPWPVFDYGSRTNKDIRLTDAIVTVPAPE